MKGFLLKYKNNHILFKKMKKQKTKTKNQIKEVNI